MDRPVRELNLELGRPDAAEAIRRLAAEVEAARKRGQKVYAETCPMFC